MPTGEKMTLPFVRTSFLKLVKARAFEEGQEPRFEASFLMDPTHKGHLRIINMIKAEAEKLAKEHWNGKVPKDLQYCFGDDGNGKEYEGYEGMFVIATNKKAEEGRVTIVDADGNPVQVGDVGWPYSGCYAHATISLWTNHHAKGGKRILANLRAIKFARDGEPFSAQAPVDMDNEFDDYGDDFSDFQGGTDDPLAEDDPLA